MAVPPPFQPPEEPRSHGGGQSDRGGGQVFQGHGHAQEGPFAAQPCQPVGLTPGLCEFGVERVGCCTGRLMGRGAQRIDRRIDARGQRDRMLEGFAGAEFAADDAMGKAQGISAGPVGSGGHGGSGFGKGGHR